MDNHAGQPRAWTTQEHPDTFVAYGAAKFQQIDRLETEMNHLGVTAVDRVYASTAKLTVRGNAAEEGVRFHSVSALILYRERSV